MKASDIQQRVTRQYEDFPYPARDPRDERKRLIGTWLDDLGLLNHHCFRGERDFKDGFRILVAGGGTGDATIFLAEQLRGMNARIVHVDVSEPSIAVARERARIRGLSEIEWRTGSLLDIPRWALGEFDYINCIGVLHHLESPEQGLDALLSALAPGGALGLMVYGQIGRTGVYQLQALLRTLHAEGDDMAARLASAKAVLAALPRSNWFKRGEELHPDHRSGGDAGIIDLLLHSQDRAYTVPQLYEWLEDRCGLHITFSDVHRGRLPYCAEIVLTGADAELRGRLGTLSQRERESIAELAGGDLVMHTLYATRDQDRQAPYGDADDIPYFIAETHPASGAQLSALIEHHKREPFLLQHSQSGLALPITCGRYVQQIFNHLDGMRSWREIFTRVRHEMAADPPSDRDLFEDFRPWFDALGLIDRLLLRRHREFR